MFGAHNRFVGVEISKPMLKAVRERFKGYIDTGAVNIKNLDLRHDYPSVKASVTLCILTLQFIPLEYRQRVVRDIYKATIPGEVLILLEKVLGDTAEIDKIMVDLYCQMKREHGYS